MPRRPRSGRGMWWCNEAWKMVVSENFGFQVCCFFLLVGLNCLWNCLCERLKVKKKLANEGKLKTKCF